MARKIYIVDDDRQIVDALTVVLEKHGYEVRAQLDDDELEQNLLRERPDLIILDVMFPEDSSAGFRIARGIRGNPELAKVPILMLSAVNEKGLYVGRFSDKDIDESFLPVDTFVEKPVKPASLIEKVTALIGP